ncbi:MAG: hypothetical protein WC832_02625 [Anaerolineales bacterium]
MKGGTACISTRIVGRAIVAAVERGQAGKCYPIGQENLTWTQMLSRQVLGDELDDLDESFRETVEACKG